MVVRVRWSEGPPTFQLGLFTIVEHIVCLLVGTVFGHPVDLHTHQRIHDGVGLLCIELRQLLGC